MKHIRSILFKPVFEHRLQQVMRKCILGVVLIPAGSVLCAATAPDLASAGKPTPARNMDSEWVSMVIDRLDIDVDEQESAELIDHLADLTLTPLCFLQTNEADLVGLGFLHDEEIAALNELKTRSLQDVSILSEPLDVNLSEEIFQLLAHFIQFNATCATSTAAHTNHNHVRHRLSQIHAVTDQRMQTVLPVAAGYLNGDYRGAPYRFQDRLVISGNGITAHLARSRQAGEPHRFPLESSFHSAHVSVNGSDGWRLLLGDFIMQKGSGLHHARGSMRTGTRNMQRLPGADLSVRPYRSGSAGRFMRGAAISHSGSQHTVTVFYSGRKLSAAPDSIRGVHGYRMPGWSMVRRTDTEAERFGNIGFRSVGMAGAVHNNLSAMVVSVAGSASYHSFSEHILPRRIGAEYVGFQGQKLLQTSISGGIQRRGLMVVTEWASSGLKDWAGTTGVRWSSRSVDLGLWSRQYDKGFTTLFGSGPGAYSGTDNERGVGSWLVLRPRRGVRVRVYADRYRSVGARPDTDVAVWGWERGAAVEMRALRGLELRAELVQRGAQRGTRIADEYGRERRVRIPQQRNTARLVLRSQPGYGLLWQVRTEWQRVSGLLSGGQTGTSAGSGLTQILRYRGNRTELIIQHTVFNTDSHDSRIYAYEYDLLNTIRIPAWSGKGQRYSVVFQIQPAHWLRIRAKAGRTLYNDRFAVGSGRDQTHGPARLDLGLQLLTQF
ncbi:MAG: hypothetical protein HLUCCA01_07685 [Bacteroidetes bacterium HLUCCA01]|nr:MAG: hypothetical protein HLUCCA01_07685 [Bacteroidetes bacterium HLUCCA01]